MNKPTRLSKTHRQPRKPSDPKRRKPGKRVEVSSKEREQIVKLKKMKFGTRRIAQKVGLGRKVIRRILQEEGMGQQSAPPSTPGTKASKLDPFREQIKQKAQQGLTVTRVLREIRLKGYTGGPTILGDNMRTLQVVRKPKKKVWRRFETQMGEETQFDWSPYRVPLGDRVCTVHAFGATLGFSRKSHVRFYLDERQSTLLEAHTHAFADFAGVTRRAVYDWMATVVLGTVGPDRKPLWHPRFLEFCDYYGYEPYLCKVRDPDRKGKDERIFHYLERDFLLASSFDSLEHLNVQVRLWLDEVANRRLHGTTRRIPEEAWEQERSFLIPLPEYRYPACDEELRQIGPDAVVSVRGTPYTVPAHLAHQTVSVRLYAEHFEVLDRRSTVAFHRRYVPEQEKGKLVIDPMHYTGVQHRCPVPGGSVAQLEEAFLKRFPTLGVLIDGIKMRMKSLAHVHLRALWRLADRYGDETFGQVATRVQTYRRFDAQAIRRILEREYPLADPQDTPSPLTSAARVLLELGEVDGGSLDDYEHLDTQPTRDDGEKDGGQAAKRAHQQKNNNDQGGPHDQ